MSIGFFNVLNRKKSMKEYRYRYYNCTIQLLFFMGLLLGGITNIIAQDPPNIILIYVDDLGYGDIGVNGAIGVKTPNVDALAKNGINFTDAHSTSATCSPSRYAILTGSYAFRNKASILQGDAPLLIDTQKGTLPKMLQDAGYKTGVVGKWHLGLGDGTIDWNQEIKPGPRQIGFDYSFLIPATGDRVPCVFLENQKVVGLDPNDPISVSYGTPIDGYPIGTEHPELLKISTSGYHLGAIINGISRIGYMKGGKKALWVDEDFPFVLSDKGVSFIKKHKEHPFFLYFSLHDIHQPRVANSMFLEKSTMGARGDVIAQMDWCVGQLTNTLETLGLTQNTMIIFTSDNGPILHDGYMDQAIELVGDHQPAGPYRGTKYSVFEGGTRMPTIVSWPGTIVPGTNPALLSQVDLYASIARLVGQKIPAGDAPDSQDVLDTWLGKTTVGRKILLEEGYTMGLRMGDWKYIQPKEQMIPRWLAAISVDPGFAKEVQLYNLKNDPMERNNIQSDHPDIVKAMQTELAKIVK